MKARVKQYLFISAAAAAIASAPAAPASAQYHNFRAEKPSVEVDLGALSDEGAKAETRPAWQKPAEDGGLMPPVVLREPLPPHPVPAPAPAVATPVPQAPVAAPVAREAAKPPAAQSAPLSPSETAASPRRVLKPLFSAPVTPPPMAEAPPVRPVTEPKPAKAPATAAPMPRRENEIPRTATGGAAPAPARSAAPPMQVKAEPVPAAPRIDKKALQRQVPLPAQETLKEETATETPAKAATIAEIPADVPRAPLMAPILEAAPAVPQPVRKPEQAAAIPAAAPTAPASRISYPPAPRDTSGIRHFDRPVLPEGLLADETAAAPVPAPARVQTQTPAAPVPVSRAAALPARKPPMQELPAIVIRDEDFAALPDEAPTATPTPRPPRKAATSAAPAVETAAPRRPSLVVIEEAPIDLPRRQPVTEIIDTAPKAAAKAAPATAAPEIPEPLEIAALPAPKPLENLPPPLSAPELERIGQNIEAVPARVAVAPPRPQPKDIVVPTLADLTLEFDGSSSELSDDTRQKLVNIIPHLTESDARRLAVHAYASGEDGSKSSARRISLSRALAVRAFLMDNGVQPTRVDVRALGLETDRKPLERVDLVFAR